MLHTLVIFRGKLRKNDSTKDAKELITHFPHHHILQTYTFYHISQVLTNWRTIVKKQIENVASFIFYVSIGISVIPPFTTQYQNIVTQFKKKLFKKKDTIVNYSNYFYTYTFINHSTRVHLRLVFLRSTQLKESYKIIAFCKWTLMPIFWLLCNMKAIKRMGQTIKLDAFWPWPF